MARPLGRLSDVRGVAGSVRLRTTAVATLAVTAVLVAASTALVTIHRDQLTSYIDAVLQQRATDIETVFETAPPLPGELAGSPDEAFAQLVDRSGRVVAATPNLVGQAALPLDSNTDSGEVIRTVEKLPVDDDVFRVLSRQVEIGDGAVLHVGATLDVVDESVGVLLGALTLTIPLVVIIVAGLVWWLVGLTLDPVEAMRAEVAGIGTTDLRRRVPVPRHDDEIARLATTMNAMLGRIEESVDRQQQFVADASHELRSPLTRLRTSIEVELATQGGDTRVLEELIEDVKGLNHLVDDLLHLARVDGGHSPTSFDLLDLDEIVFSEAQRMKIEHLIDVDASGVRPVQVMGSTAQLARAVRNLCDNAGRDARSAVVFTLGETSDAVVLTVTDDGPGIPPDKADAVFERFVKLDSSRTKTTGGTGLGLSIAREIVERHEGTLNLDTSHEQGARFVVTFPRPDLN